jgi:hypothetical protein
MRSLNVVLLVVSSLFTLFAHAAKYVSSVDIGVAKNGTWHLSGNSQDAGTFKANVEFEANFPNSLENLDIKDVDECSDSEVVRTGEDTTVECKAHRTVYELTFRDYCHWNGESDVCEPSTITVGQGSGIATTSLVTQHLNAYGSISKDVAVSLHEKLQTKELPQQIVLTAYSNYNSYHLPLMKYAKSTDGEAYINPEIQIVAHAHYILNNGVYALDHVEFNDSTFSFGVGYWEYSKQCRDNACLAVINTASAGQQSLPVTLAPGR